MKNSILLFWALFSVLPLGSQPLDQVQEPSLFSPQFRVYLDPAGNDSQSGDSLFPLATFSAALNRLETLSAGLSGEVYSEVVLFPGTYPFALEQSLGQYQLGGRNLNVGVRGKGEVVLDGTGLTLSGGSGMVHLLGSHILVRNLHILYSPANGVNFGYDWNGTRISPHDVWVDSVRVENVGGMGIIGGLLPVSSWNQFVLNPRSQRFLISNCSVQQSVNFNTPQSQWGSSIKLLNVQHGVVRNCTIHDNSGEGIDLDFCDSVSVHDNILWDNYANIYLDKVQNVWVHHNQVYNTTKVMNGLLMAMEAFSGLVTDHFVQNVFIHNNVFQNTTGISFWQGSYSFAQTGTFDNIQIHHNTLVGKQRANGALIGFSYNTSLGQPVPNVSFSNIQIERNILSAHADSLNFLQLMSAPLDPQPGLTTGFNLYNMDPSVGLNLLNDRIEPGLPTSLPPGDWASLTPDPSNQPLWVYRAPNLPGYADDFFHHPRALDSTQVGAIELGSPLGLTEIHAHFPSPFFPNPCKGTLFHSSPCPISLTLTDLQGKIVFSGRLEPSETLCLPLHGTLLARWTDERGRSGHSLWIWAAP